MQEEKENQDSASTSEKNCVNYTIKHVNGTICYTYIDCDGQHVEKCFEAGYMEFCAQKDTVNIVTGIAFLTEEENPVDDQGAPTNQDGLDNPENEETKEETDGSSSSKDSLVRSVVAIMTIISLVISGVLFLILRQFSFGYWWFLVIPVMVVASFFITVGFLRLVSFLRNK